MPPTVTLSSFWPVMLMVFTGLMTLPTLIISAVVVARIPEPIDTKGITASIDSSSINQLTSVTASLNSIKTALALQNSYLSNNVSALNGQSGGSGDTPDNANAKGKTHLHLDEVAACGSNDPATYHTTNRYLLGGGDTVLIKVCAAECGLKASATAYIMPGAKFTTTSIKALGVTKTYTGNTVVTLNPGTNAIQTEVYFTNTTFLGMLDRTPGGQVALDSASVDMSALAHGTTTIPNADLSKWEGYRKNFAFQYTLDETDTVKNMQVRYYYRSTLPTSERKIQSSDVPTGLAFTTLPTTAPMMPDGTSYTDTAYTC